MKTRVAIAFGIAAGMGLTLIMASSGAGVGGATISRGGGGNGSGVPTGCTNSNGILTCNQFISTFAGSGGINDGGANFSCPNNPGASSPCLFAPQGSLEAWATNIPFADAGLSLGQGNIWMVHTGRAGCNYSFGQPGGFTQESMIDAWGYTPDGGADVFTMQHNCNGDLHTLGWQYSGGRFISSAADAYFGVASGGSVAAVLYIPANPGGLQLYNSAAADVMDIDSAGNILLAAGATKSRGSIALSVGTGTATVRSGAVCVCSETTDATKTLKCAVSGTTLTATGNGSDVINYICL